MMPRQNIPGLLVGHEFADDAGVFQLTSDIALVQTVDYFPPIVDDPYIYGQVAATNALSDVYAMGGVPRTALSIVGFPSQGLDFSILGRIMEGGLDKLNEAGVALLGGHSVRDDEVKFGYAVTGVIDPKNIKQNRGGRAGSRVILTKPLGTGLVTTAIKRGKASPEHIEAAVTSMLRLNRRAAEICIELEVDTMTDITGFGLAGHACEVAKSSGISILMNQAALPLLPGALDYSQQGFCAGGLTSNQEYFGKHIFIADSVSPQMRNVFFDPQTSGGLLVFCPTASTRTLLEKLQSEDIPAVEVGMTAKQGDHLLTLT
jgi:selenide,water dikinase